MLKISDLVKRYGGGEPVLKNLDLTIEGTELPLEELEAVLARVDDLASLDKHARGAIRRESKAGEDTGAGQYVRHHIDELPPEALRTLFGTEDRSRIKPQDQDWLPADAEDMGNAHPTLHEHAQYDQRRQD